MKIISTIENFMVDGVLLPIGHEIEVLAEDIHKYIGLNGVKEVESLKKEAQTELHEEVETITTDIEKGI